MWLTEAQVQDLTKKKRPSAQIRALVESGIHFTVVAGRPIVTDKALNEEKRVRKVPKMP